MREKGFTLVELIITISILAILMSIALISYQGVQQNSRDNKRKSDISAIQSALELYHADQGYYPATITFGSPLTFGTKTYMTKVPQDAQLGFLYIYIPLSTSSMPQNSFCDNVTTRCINYCLYAPIENKTNAKDAYLCIVNDQQYQVQAP